MYRRTFSAATFLMLVVNLPLVTMAAPTLKGPLPGEFQLDPDTGLATLRGAGRLTLMGKVAVYGEFRFVPGEG
jgi:hypothetical protein